MISLGLWLQMQRTALLLKGNSLVDLEQLTPVMQETLGPDRT